MLSQLDSKWYQRLRGIVRPIGESFNLLEPPLDIQKAMHRKFEDSGYTEAVPLFPDPSIVTDLDLPYRELDNLQLEIAESEQHNIVKKQYLAYIEDARVNIDMIRAACRQDSEEYERLNDILYGKPDRSVYTNVCDWVRKEYRLARDEFVGIVAHEIGSHIYESVNGASQPLRLLEMGLSGYALSNEGRALIREQIVYDDIYTALQQPS